MSLWPQVAAPVTQIIKVMALEYPRWSQVADQIPVIHMTLCSNSSNIHQPRPWIQTWPWAATLAWMTPWSSMIVQETHISMALVVAWPLDTLMTTECSSDPKHLCGHQQRF